MLKYSSFNNVTVSDVVVKNPMVRSPMTGRHTNKEHTPSPLVIDYYCQHSQINLINKCTSPSTHANAYARIPGIYTHKSIIQILTNKGN